MIDTIPDPNCPDLTGWFPEPLPDETVYFIHLFLQQFTYQFEGIYYRQIKRYLDAERAAMRTEHNPDTPWDDSIDF